MSNSPEKEPERRDLVEAPELRAAPEGTRSPGTMVGYAAVFDRYSEDLGTFREKLAPGAFARAIVTGDVRALVNHDPNQLIGRQSAGTLRLAEDARGLRVEVDLPDTTIGRDLAESIRRGDMSGQSFSFTTEEAHWDFNTEPPTRTVRSIATLYDVGPVAFPAYSDTTVAVRSFTAERAKREAPPEPEPEPPPPPPDHSNQYARLRLLET